MVNRLGYLQASFLTLYLVHSHLTTPAQAGTVIAAQGGGSVVGALIGGAVSDRVGSRRTILGSQLAACLAALALLLFDSLALLVPLVVVLGALSTIHRPAGAALIARNVDGERLPRAYGLLYWATNIGSSFAPVISGWTTSIDPQSIFALSAAGSAGYLLIAWRLPDDPPPAADGSQGRVDVPGLVRTVFAPFSTVLIGPFLGLAFILALVYYQWQSALPMDMSLHDVDGRTIGLILGLNGLLVVALQPLVSVFAARLRMRTAFLLAAVLLGTGFGLHGVFHQVPGYLVAVAIWTCGEVVLAPMSAAFIASHSDTERQGTYQGSYYFVWNLGLAVGAPLGGWGLAAFGSTVLWGTVMALALLAGLGHLALSRRHSYD
ncbi:MFS transporter [Kitasatospora sp. NPDC056531]|uniref:MFS transporter n=1 Tax=Kitasatospora sp. NPDC056531 TaxID=3345856 RepID=UPI0036A53C50